jgi:hypothetical protein
VSFNVEVTQEFETWWHSLSEDERISVDGMIRVFEAHRRGVELPYSSGVDQAGHSSLRQLRVPHGDRVICVMYVADVARDAVVLLTGSTAGNVDEVCPPDEIVRADAIYAAYRNAKGRH